MKCPQCQVENKEIAKNCRKCGQSLELKPVWQPTWAWHKKTLIIIYVVVVVLFFVVKSLMKLYVRELPPDVTPWLHRSAGNGPH